MKDILVQEGDRVAAGDPVIILDATAAESMRNRLKGQLNSLEAVEARAIAERDGAKAIAFPQHLLKGELTAEVARIVEDQDAEFRARLERHDAELAIFQQQISAAHDEIAGLEAQSEAIKIQLELIQEEKEDSEGLLKKGLAKKGQVLELRRAEAQLIGQQGQLTAGIAKARQAIAQTEQEMQRLRVSRLEEASRVLSEVRLQRSDILERLRAAQDTLDRAVLLSPVTGTVMNLAKYNSGAVIAPGQDVMEVVPERTGSDLIVEAHVRPQDIDQVRIGQAARLNFAALDQRQTPPVPGEVLHVSADQLENERTGEVYYLARLRISAEPLPGFDPSQIGPGQPADVFITTGERTLVSYLVEPLVATFRRAMKES